MGTVVNMGTNDEYFVFRGTEAREFLAGLTLIRTQEVVLVLANGRRIKSQLSVTPAATFVLSMPCEDLGDAMAQILFDLTIEKYFNAARSRGAGN